MILYPECPYCQNPSLAIEEGEKFDNYRCTNCSYRMQYNKIRSSINIISFNFDLTIKGAARSLFCHLLYDLNKTRITLSNGHDVLVASKVFDVDFPSLNIFKSKIEKYLLFL